MKKALLILTCLMLGLSAPSTAFAADYKWGKTKCKVACNRLACKVTSFADKCAENCNPEHVEKCVAGAEETARKSGIWNKAKCQAACNRATCGASKSVARECLTKCPPDTIQSCTAASRDIANLKNNATCVTLCNRLSCTVNPLIGFACKGCPSGTADKCKAAFNKVWVPKFLQR